MTHPTDAISSISRRRCVYFSLVVVFFSLWMVMIVKSMMELDQVTLSFSSENQPSSNLPPLRSIGGGEKNKNRIDISSSHTSIPAPLSAATAAVVVSQAVVHLRHSEPDPYPPMPRPRDNTTNPPADNSPPRPPPSRTLWDHPRGQLLPQTHLPVLHPLTYGSVLSGRYRTPLVMIEMTLDSTLHQHLLQHQHMFSCNQTELDNISSLDRRVKLPVYIYEGYFHSLTTNTHIYSRNPNPLIGVDFMKPPASDLVRAFYTALRRVNRENIFLPLQEALFASARSRNPHQPKNDVCYFLASWIQQDKIFADISIQIHYGEGNALNFPRAWHVDAENSLLHLAVTLRGSRVLHSKRCAQDHGPAQEILQPQHPGDVYLSSSALMLHAPRFSYASYEDRVIALHARILYTTAELNLFRKYRTEESWKSLTSILSDTLSRADVQLPSLEQVQSIEEQLQSAII